MIKINLLHSVTDRPEAGVATVIEAKVVNPRTQMMVVAVAVAALFVLVVVFDYVTANSAYNQAQTDLAEQQRIAADMARVNAEIRELEQRTRQIEERTNAIRNLRASQRGPVAVLSAINERLPPFVNFRLERIEQTGDQLTITGDSQRETAVTQFGQSLEFSNGLFTNVNIELQRRAMDGAATSQTVTTPTGETLTAPVPQTVGFTIRCQYTPPRAALQQSSAPPPANQVAQR